MATKTTIQLTVNAFLRQMLANNSLRIFVRRRQSHILILAVQLGLLSADQMSIH